MALSSRSHSLTPTSLCTDPWPRFKCVRPIDQKKSSAEYSSLKRYSHAAAVRCCTSTSSSPSQAASAKSVRLTGNEENENGRLWKDGGDRQQLLYLTSDHGWKVRRLIEEDGYEMRKVAQIQSEAFHQPLPLFDHLFFDFFKAEVLSGLLYKLKTSPANRYACLVAESPSDASITRRKLVGVVDVTALTDKAVLQHLPGADEYLYVSGLAVSKRYRRRKIGSSLLKACDVLGVLWGFKFLALRVYEEDLGARKLYTNVGYRVVSGDPPWMTTWIGRKRRLLMIKRCN